MELKAKTVVISGADGGMGRVICRSLAEEGACLALASNRGESVLALRDELLRTYPGLKVFAAEADVTREESVRAFMEAAHAALGSFDVLLNLAGLSIPTKYDEAPVEAYETMMDVNVKGAFLMSKHFAAFAADPARIVNIGSMAARNTNANAPVYCMAKAAVNKLSEGLLLQLGKKGILVSTVNPGGADTPFWGDRPVDRTKLMKAEDAAGIILFVAHLAPNIQLHSVDFESAAKFRG